MGPLRERIINVLQKIEKPLTLLDLRNKVNIEGGWENFVMPDEFDEAVKVLQAEGVIEVQIKQGSRIGNLVLLREQR